MKLSVYFLVVQFYISSADSARILGIAPVPSYSHQVLLQPIWKELSLRGHQLTVLTTDPMNDSTLTNLTEIDIRLLYDVTKDVKAANLVNVNFVSFIRLTLEYMRNLTRPIFTHPEVEALVRNSSEHFDLVMIEPYFPSMYIFPERFRCPFIGLTTLESASRNYAALGNPYHPILYPEPRFLSINLTFLERLAIVLKVIFSSMVEDYVMLPQQQIMVDELFGTQYPRLHESEKKMSMMFTNTDLVFHPRRPLLPNVVRIGGGIHLNPIKPLPEKLKAILDGADQGAIYFSLGSNVKSKDLSAETQQIFLETFAELPYLVLWKFELDGMVTPKNVITSKWFPQQDIFGHPNIRLFIFQGGLQSMEEAVHNYVPMVGIPFFSDQARNMRVIVEKGMGISLQFDNLNKESFKKAVLEVIETPRYRDQVEKWAKVAKDEPMTGLEKAVWWTEYVIRHKGAPHFKQHGIPFYQHYLVDVIGFCLIAVLLALLVLTKFVTLFIVVLNWFFQKQKFKRK